MAEHPCLRGPELTLRPLRASDARAMFADINNSALADFTGGGGVISQDSVVAHCASVETATDRLDYAMVRNGIVIGELVLNRFDLPNETATFRMAIWNPTNWGHGYGREALPLFLAHAWATLPINRIELEVFAHNPRALHLYRSVGFVEEGRRRQALRLQGEWIDAVQMAMLRREWAGGPR